MILKLKARFIKTAVLEKDYPVIRDLKGNILPEIAVVGRSNVGKSSLLNHLFNEKKLVKTSSTPGKTQSLNFFAWGDQMAFADLPGYGYAQVPSAVKKAWGPMIQKYLEVRESLKLVLFLLDIRRLPGKEDLQFLEWAIYYQKAIILVLTKTDKVNQKEKKENTKKILDCLNLVNLHTVHYSVLKNKGQKELMHMIQDALKDESTSET